MKIELLEQLSNVYGISGQEKYATRLFKEQLNEYVDRFDYDNLGSCMAYKNGKDLDKVIMLAGHIDEVGFIVKTIEDDGYLRIIPIGGWWPHVLLSQSVAVINSKGEEFYGVIGSRPPHGLPADVRNKVMETKDLFVDLGVANKDEVIALGIKQGDMIVPDTKFRRMNNSKYLMGKALDNRAGLAAIVEVMQMLKEDDTDYSICAVASVQEEVGCRGALTAANKVKPVISLAIDVTLANDIPGVDKNEVVLGCGIGLSIMDASQLVNKGLMDTMVNICTKHDIKYVYDAMPNGGTDTGAIHKSNDGVIAMTLSIPSRYIHSHRSLIHEDDYDCAVKLIYNFVKDMNDELLNKIIESNR